MSDRICRQEKCDKPAEMYGEWCHDHRMIFLASWMRLKAMKEVL